MMGHEGSLDNVGEFNFAGVYREAIERRVGRPESLKKVKS